MSQLETFYLKFNETNDEDVRDGDYLWPDDQFISSFWLERNWIFQAEIHTATIIYSIYPHRKTWHEYSMTKNCPSSILTLYETSFKRSFRKFVKTIQWITTTTDIYIIYKFVHVKFQFAH
jgi:hypothetical protein